MPCSLCTSPKWSVPCVTDDPAILLNVHDSFYLCNKTFRPYIIHDFVYSSFIISCIHHSSCRVFIIHHFVYSSPIISSVHHPSFRLYIIHHFVCTSPIISSIHHPSFRLYIIHPGLDISRVSCYGTVSAIHRNLLVSATSH